MIKVIDASGDISEELTQVFQHNQIVNPDRPDDYINLIVEGKPGCGKTGKVRAWLDFYKESINYHEISASLMPYPLTNEIIDKIGRINSVLFIDDTHRANEQQSQLISQLEKREILDKRCPDGKKKLNNLILIIEVKTVY